MFLKNKKVFKENEIDSNETRLLRKRKKKSKIICKNDNFIINHLLYINRICSMHVSKTTRFKCYVQQNQQMKSVAIDVHFAFFHLPLSFGSKRNKKKNKLLKSTKPFNVMCDSKPMKSMLIRNTNMNIIGILNLRILPKMPK